MFSGSFLPYLTTVINHVFATSFFLDDLKLVEIISAYKKDNPCYKESYRLWKRKQGMKTTGKRCKQLIDNGYHIGVFSMDLSKAFGVPIISCFLLNELYLDFLKNLQLLFKAT